MTIPSDDKDSYFYQFALQEAQKGLTEGGIPIGAALVYNDEVLAVGHNQRCQKESATLHGEMDAFEKAGRLPAKIYQQSTLYTTLSPCPMCAGTAILYKIPRIVIGENKNFMGAEDWLQNQGIQLKVLQDPTTIELMASFIRNHPKIWYEDIGE